MSITLNLSPDLIVDHALFDALDEDPECFEFRNELSEDFIRQSLNDVDHFVSCLSQANFHDLKAYSHQQKSGSLTLGFYKVSNCYSKIEYYTGKEVALNPPAHTLT
eukprot:Colp12_sorted_trinity150504_noHs@5179